MSDLEEIEVQELPLVAEKVVGNLKRKDKSLNQSKVAAMLLHA